MTEPDPIPGRFDALVPHATPKSPRIIWTLPAIGKRLGRGPGFAQAMLMLKDCPIRRHGRHYFAVEDELIAYMRRQGLAMPKGRRR